MITKEIFLEKMHSIFEETPKLEITFNTKFKELEEWSSLLILGLIVSIEDSFSILLSADQINSADTLHDLFCILEQRNVK